MVDFLLSILLVGLLVEGTYLSVRACYRRKKRKEQQEQMTSGQERENKGVKSKGGSHLPRDSGALNGQKQRVCLSILGTAVSISPSSAPAPCQGPSSSPSVPSRNSFPAAVYGSQTNSPSLNSRRLSCNSIAHPSSSTSPRRFLNTVRSQHSSRYCCDNTVNAGRSPLGCSITSRSSQSWTTSNASWKASTVVRGSGFKMATFSKGAVAASAVGTTFADRPVTSFTESVVGRKLNVSSGFFGRSLSVHSASSSRDRSNSRSSSRHPSRPGSAFASIAPSPAQTPVEQPREAPTKTIIQDGKKIECYGVFCVTYDLKEDERPKTWKKMVRIAVSGAAGAISNHLVFKLASGEVFGPDQPIALNLLGSVRSRDALEGVAMELEDSLFPLLREVNIGIEPLEVFRDADWALLIGAKPRGPGMERADLLDINGRIFAEQAKALNEAASPNVKVLVVGNPCNTNALIAMKNAPRIPAKNFHALTRLDENRAKCQLALKAGVFYDNVSNVTIWGNHSTTQVPDFLNAKIHGRHVKDVITDHTWLEEEFTPTVQKRGGLLIKKWGRSSAASTAVSIADAIKSLITPTPDGDWFSSGVYAVGNPYGVSEDIVFSMPCRSKGDGNYELVPDVLIDDYLQTRIKKSEDELLSERRCVSHLIGESGGFCDITEDTMLPGEL